MPSAGTTVTPVTAAGSQELTWAHRCWINNFRNHLSRLWYVKCNFYHHFADLHAHADWSHKNGVSWKGQPRSFPYLPQGIQTVLPGSLGVSDNPFGEDWRFWHPLQTVRHRTTAQFHNKNVAKKGLIHVSDFPTLKSHNVICKQAIKLKRSVL